MEYYELFPEKFKGLYKVIHAAPNYGHSSSVRSVSFSPDGTKLASGSGDHTIKIWELDQDNIISSITFNYASSVNSVL